LLPLIIQALVSTEGDLIIAEQPEIHLNPKLQCVLAELLAFMANKQQRVIVETHSEHLLLRLRLLVANGTISQNDIAIYFVEKDKTTSVIREIPIEVDGHIDNSSWPSGFFEESLKDAFALSSAQIQRSKQKHAK
jgi:predicted ATPase